jgi:hypothetical protein
VHRSGHGLLAAEVSKNVLRLLLTLNCGRLRRERLGSIICQEWMQNFAGYCSTGYSAKERLTAKIIEQEFADARQIWGDTRGQKRGYCIGGQELGLQRGRGRYTSDCLASLVVALCTGFSCCLVSIH